MTDKRMRQHTLYLLFLASMSTSTVFAQTGPATAKQATPATQAANQKVQD